MKIAAEPLLETALNESRTVYWQALRAFCAQPLLVGHVTRVCFTTTITWAGRQAAQAFLPPTCLTSETKEPSEMKRFTRGLALLVSGRLTTSSLTRVSQWRRAVEPPTSTCRGCEDARTPCSLRVCMSLPTIFVARK